MPAPSTAPFGSLAPRDFLDTYWQKKPLFIRDAFPDFTSPVSANELAGLACEPDVQSRLILEQGGTHPWELRHGPFDPSVFGDLPETHWTLLVQEVDRLLPDAAALLDHFDVVPSWRLDDIMISYAPEGGNVGAHIDNYDVFLLQAEGTREWAIGHDPVENERIVPDLDVRILADFTPDETLTARPGDLLYLPPRVAHHGISKSDDCLTISVGFRAPSHRALVQSFAQDAAQQIPDTARYSDPDRPLPDAPGELPTYDRERARQLVRQRLESLLSDDAALDDWFARTLTTPAPGRDAPPREEPLSPETLVAHLRDGTGLRRGPVAHLVFADAEDGTRTLYINGQARALSEAEAPLAPRIAGRARIPANDVTDLLDRAAVQKLLTELVNDGVLELDHALADA